MKKALLVMILTLSLSMVAFAEDYGHEGINDDAPELQDMLKYALEDELIAYSTYEEIVKAFDVLRPFTNIMKAEQTHIEMVEELMKNYNLDIPEIDSSSHITLPVSLEDAFKFGVQAEIENIALYEKFLDGDIPDDVRAVFEYLIAGSENHLSAFERQVERDNVNFSRSTTDKTRSNQSNSSGRGYRNR